MRLCEELETGREVEVDMEADVLTDLSTGKKYSLKPLGDVRRSAHNALGRTELFSRRMSVACMPECLHGVACAVRETCGHSMLAAAHRCCAPCAA